MSVLMLTRAEACALLTSANYRFAKTMPECPHFYTLRKQWSDGQRFEAVVQYIRDFGVIERWGKYRHTYLYLNGLKYWTMGAPLHKTILINRALVESYNDGITTPYDAIADVYDAAFDDEASHAQDRRIAEQVAPLIAAKRRLLDVGCGTGLLIDLFPDIAPGNYLGIDPSAKMLARLRLRHPAFEATTMLTRLEDFWDGEGFDSIVSLHGSANYIDPESLKQLPSMLKPGGEGFVMLFDPSYVPETYRRTGKQMRHHVWLPNLSMWRNSQLERFDGDNWIWRFAN